MPGVLVDSNVILDVLTEDPTWGEWSTTALATTADTSVLVINPLIYAEVSVRFSSVEELEDAVPANVFERHPLPYEAAFLAGKAFIRNRSRRGQRHAVLPDFYIGAHAAIAGLTLLTREARRYRTYFPGVALLSP